MCSSIGRFAIGSIGVYGVLGLHARDAASLSGAIREWSAPEAGDPWLLPARILTAAVVVLEFSRPGKPTDNAFIETFNGTLRDECLNIHWFGSINEAKQLIEAWRIDHNESRPHMALGNKTPAEYLLQASPSPVAQGKKAAEN